MPQSKFKIPYCPLCGRKMHRIITRSKEKAKAQARHFVLSMGDYYKRLMCANKEDVK